MSGLVKCKACQKEIAKGVKKCIHCGKDQRNFIMRHKIISGILILLFIVIVTANNGEEGDKRDNQAAPTSGTTSTISEKATEKNTIKKYGNGKYLVGKDIQSGLYKVKITDSVMKMGYIERAKDLNMELDSILANIILTGDGYVEIKNSDVAIKLQGVEIYPIDINTLKKDIKKEIHDGIYLVGFDIEAGTYKVQVTDTITGMGYVERAKNVSMGIDDIIANEIVQGQGYVNIKESDYAIRVQGATLIFQE